MPYWFADGKLACLDFLEMPTLLFAASELWCRIVLAA